MKQWKQVSAVAAAVMALSAGGVQAMGLGTPTSRAILGESLRMTVPLELEVGEDTDDGCPQAEVLYGDSRVEPSKVILGVSPQSGRHRVLSVRVIQPVNEPLIEVNLSYGCGARLSRRFTVFASPPEFVPTVVLTPASVASPGTASTAEGASADSGIPVVTRGASSGSPERASRALPRASRPVPVRRPAEVSAPAAPTAAPKPKAPPPVEVKSAEPTAPAPVAAPAPAPAPVAKPAPAAPPASVAAPAEKASSVVLRKPAPPAPKPAPVSRLVLDPVTPVVASLPGAGASDAASGVQPNLASSQTGTDIERLQTQLAQDRQRLDEMEKLVTQLRKDAGQAASGVGITGPIGLTDARHPVWLVAVSAVAALSLLFSGVLFMRLRRYEQAREWWTPPER